MQLKNLHKRIKYSRLWKHPKNGSERLYIKHGRNTAKMRVNTWFEIVNDRITPRVEVDCFGQNRNWEINQAEQIKASINRQYYELINDCELERRKVPLHERLKDDVIPVYENSMLHQAQALRFCCSMKTTALFADTGTGKSKIAIDIAVSRFEAEQINKVFIFCPVSTKKNFQDEIRKWADDIDLKWHIIGLESISSSEGVYVETLKFIDADTMIIIDESHLCKTPTAKRSKRIKMCCEKCSYKVIMTGTPADSVRDLYMQYAMLSDLIIGEPNWLKFEEKYLILGGFSGDEVVGYKNVDYLMGLVEPYTYQISKEECLELPGKKIIEKSCKLTDVQWSYYNSTKQELLDKLENVEEDVPVYLIFLYLTRLQQISCGIYNVDDEYKYLGTNKFQLLDDIKGDSQMIIFCKYLFEVDKIVEHLGRENCAVFTGDNRKERDAEKNRFTAGKKQFFVATMSSGGTGLNGLQHCNTIVFWSHSFKYRERKQCVGRIDRKGQENEMYIYDFRPSCGIERKINQNLSKKKNLADEIKGLLNEKTKLKKYVEEL